MTLYDKFKEFLEKIKDFCQKLKEFCEKLEVSPTFRFCRKTSKKAWLQFIKPHFKRTMHEPNMSKGKFKAKGESATKDCNKLHMFRYKKRQKKQASGNIGITNVFIFGHKHSKWSTRESVKKYKRVRVAIMVWLNHGALIN